MPPSTLALLETHYTGLNTVLALAYNISATQDSHEDLHKDLSPEQTNYNRRTIIIKY